VADVITKLAALTTFAICMGCSSRARPNADGQSAGKKPKTPEFVCNSVRCVQAYPRFPDDGEWTCHDMAGIAVCSGGDPPAGVPFNPSDPAWVCGQRRTARAARTDGERVCVNLAPDFPDGTARGWRCHYKTDDDVRRICERADTVGIMGVPCGQRVGACIDGLRCVGGRCQPDPPSPSCILDSDCDEGACRFGSCWRGPT
jgi:hypothetical protein